MKLYVCYCRLIELMFAFVVDMFLTGVSDCMFVFEFCVAWFFLLYDIDLFVVLAPNVRQQQSTLPQRVSHQHISRFT